ncbi:interferon-induced protein with tetratricopeptide repeats 5-like [Gastrophryne carolinensis]
MLEVFRGFGVPVAHEKTEGPATSIKFLRIEIDTVEEVCRLPADKVRDLETGLEGILGLRKIRLKQLQSVLGKLNFACRVLPMGQVFMRRLSLATVEIKEPYHFIRLTAERKEDVQMWVSFLKSFNGLGVPSKTDLKFRLLQLKCHFTWQLLEKDSDADELQESLDYQLVYLETKNKYMVYNLRAYIMHLKEDYTEAINNLKQAEKKIKESNSDATDKRFLVTFGNYAWVYYYLKQYDEAQKYIERIDQIYEKLKQASNGTENIAEIYGEEGWSLLTFCGQYYEKAKECFAKASELDPEEPEWHAGYAIAVYRLEGFHSKKCPASELKSLELLQNAVELGPKDASLKALLALKLQDFKREEEGEVYIKEALNQAPDLPYVLRYAAKFYRRAGHVDQALRLLYKAIDLIPTSGFLHHQLGLCYRRKMIDLKKTQERGTFQRRGMNTESIDEFTNKAIYHFEKVLEYKKTFVYAYSDLASMYCEIKDYKRAEETFQKVFQFPNLTDEEKQGLHQNYGRFQEYHMKSQAVAIKHYKECFQIKEPSLSRDNSEKALKRMAERKIRSYPPEAAGFALLGFVYKNKGQREDAIEYYEQALKYDRDNEEYLSELCELKLQI